MIIVLKPNADEKKYKELEKRFREEYGLDIHYSRGEKSTILGLVGDTSKVDIEAVRAIDIVDSVTRIQEPYKAANRKFHPMDSVIEVAGVKIGGGNFVKIAGPCSVETIDQITGIARSVKASGANMLRGGAFKPRTSPYAFQGLGRKGIEYLLEAKKATGLPIVTEIMELTDLEMFADVDIIQVGARNMQNFRLLKELGMVHKPILLKRGLANTISELLMSAEYIMAGGNEKVILCERGIRTFETATRNTLDISAIPVLREKTHLPIIVDPSHSTGYSKYVKDVTLAATAAGADGIIVEVHNDPEHAWCDGQQSITPEAFAKLSVGMDKIREVVTNL